MNFRVTQQISDNPFVNGRRFCRTEVSLLDNGFQMYCSVGYLQNAGNDRITSIPIKTYTPSTVGEFVDSNGDKVPSTDPNAQPKLDFLTNIKVRNGKGVVEEFKKMIKDEVTRLDNRNYFNT